MTAGISGRSIRSSPAIRCLLGTGSRTAHARVPILLSRSLADTMLGRASKEAAASAPPPPRSKLSKPVFLAATPALSNGDIRERLKGQAPVDAVASAAPARIAQSLHKPVTSRPSPTARSGNQERTAGSLVSLYGSSTSLPHQAMQHSGPAGSCAGSKIEETVYFNEDDFSDDANLDLDYEAPASFPSTSGSKEALSGASLPPPPTPTQPEILIPWSSSPASHFVPPKPSRPFAAAVDESRASETKAEISKRSESSRTRAKKRILPESFQPHEPQQVIKPRMGDSKPKLASKSAALWDSPADAIQAQKRQLKNRRTAGKGLDEAGSDSGNAAELSASKPVAISLSNEQRHVLDLVVNKNASVFFTGPAGTGKSVLMRAIISEMKRKYARDPERVAVTASTGLAACNIGGITLHSFSGIGLGKEDAPALVRKIRRNPKAKNRWLRTKCLIIDEVSMVDGDLFDKLSQIGRTIRSNGRPWGGIQLVITGDFFQLPPVPDSDKNREAKFAFDSATWSTSVDHTIGLTQIFRQRDPDFARMLNEMRLGKITQATVDAFKLLSRPLKFDDGVDSAELFPTRAQVEGSNEKRLRQLTGESIRFEAIDTGDPAIRDKLLMNVMAPKRLELKVHAQVMLIKNLDETLVNGSLGKVIGFSDEKSFEMRGGGSSSSGGGEAGEEGSEERMAQARRKLAEFSHDGGSGANGRKYPVVQFISTDGVPRVILCQPEEWKVELPNGEIQAKRIQLPLILAWALSIHKAQGQTLERVTVDLGRVFENGQAYVALSRATTQQGLRVLRFDKSKVMAHPRVVDFYHKLYSAEAACKMATATNGLVEAAPGQADGPMVREKLKEGGKHNGNKKSNNSDIKYDYDDDGSGLADDEEAMASYVY